MRQDSDDRLLLSGIGINHDHEKLVLDRLFSKPFLSSFNYDNTDRERFHYTSPEGLMGILKTRTFHFTDSQFLNDYREKININDELDWFWKANRRRFDKQFVRLLEKIRVTKFEDSGFSYIDHFSDEPCRYFVLSLSMNDDSLSMWKYYSKAENYNGYCIRLFSYALDDEWIDRNTGVATIASMVEYRSEIKQQIIGDTIDRLYSIWESYEYSEDLNQKIIKEFHSWISVEALFFKDKCFEEEQETRYIAIVPTRMLNDIFYEYKGKSYKMYDFKIRNGAFVPYIKMPFNDWNEDTCWAINGIRIGPSTNADQKELGLKQFMDSLDYKFADCQVVKSTIPVRY